MLETKHVVIFVLKAIGIITLFVLIVIGMISGVSMAEEIGKYIKFERVSRAYPPSTNFWCVEDFHFQGDYPCNRTQLLKHAQDEVLSSPMVSAVLISAMVIMVLLSLPFRGLVGFAGILVILGVIAVLAWYYYKKQKKMKEKTNEVQPPNRRLRLIIVGVIAGTYMLVVIPIFIWNSYHNTTPELYIPSENTSSEAEPATENVGTETGLL